jgi:hypothetical protein
MEESSETLLQRRKTCWKKKSLYWSHFQFLASLRTRWIQQSFGSLLLYERIIHDGNGESQEKKRKEESQKALLKTARMRMVCRSGSLAATTRRGLFF